MSTRRSQQARGSNHGATASVIASPIVLGAALGLAATFLVPMELMAPEVRQSFARALQGARASGTPFVSFFAPSAMETLGRQAGFREAQHVPSSTLSERSSRSERTA